MDFDFPASLSDFIQDNSRHKFVVGPLGSGKTFACLMNLLLLATQQAPSTTDGIRRTRFVIARQTLQQLKMTVLKDILLHFSSFIDYRVSESTVYIRGPGIHSEWILLPLETPDDQRRLLSMQLTGVFFNEFVELDPGIIVAAFGRCGRYPPMQHGGPSWYGLMADSNPGTMDSPWFKLLVEDLPEGWAYHQQEDPFQSEILEGSGEVEYLADPSRPNSLLLQTNVDNIANLVEDYYGQLLHGATKEWAERYVHGQWGESLAGQAVFKNSFIPRFHIAKKDLVPIPGRVLIIGLDTGRHPAAVFMQQDQFGRLLVLQEAYAENMGIKTFLRDKIMPMVYTAEFYNCPVACVVDPAGRQKSQIGEQSVVDAIRGEGLEAHLASTNALDPRLRAVEHWLLQQRDGGPAIIFDRYKVLLLLHALRSGYRFKKRKIDDELEEKPEKNHPDSDMADALQYGCLGMGESIYGRIMRRINRPPPRPEPTAGGWT